MNGSEAALAGVVESDPVLTSRAGRPWVTLSVAVTHACEEARTASVIQVAAFGPGAERLYEIASVGSRIHAQGRLRRIEQQNGATGETRHELELAARRIGVVGAVAPPPSGTAVGESLRYAAETR